MTNDELAAAFGVLMVDLHARIDALPDSPVKTKAQHKAALAHEALERLRDHFAENGQVHADSGGDPKTPPAP